MLYNNIYGTNDLLNVLVSEEDRVNIKNNRRKLDDNKTEKQGNSCFRKGLHKSEKDWKRSSRRIRRHEAVKECAYYTPKMNDIEDYVLNMFLDHYDMVEIYFNNGVHNYWSPSENKYVYGIEIAVKCTTYGDPDYEIEDHLEYRSMFLTFEELIKLGLVE